MSLLQINNGETGLSARNKINAAITAVNGLTAGFGTIGANTTIANTSGFTYQLTVQSITILLPAAPAATFVVTFANYSGGNCTINGNGNNIRSGSAVTGASATIVNDEVLKFIYTGTQWLLTT